MIYTCINPIKYFNVCAIQNSHHLIFFMSFKGEPSANEGACQIKSWLRPFSF